MILDTQNQSENTKDKTKCKAGLGCHNKCLEKEDKNSTDILLDIKYVRNILKDDKRFNETFELINPIKAGSGGAVHKIKHIKSQKPFAMKIMNKRNAKNKEALIHAKLKHQARWDKKNAAADAQASCTSTTHEQDAAADAQAGSLDEMRLDEMRCDEASDARTRARAREAEGWCMDGRQEGFRVLDSSGKGHHVPSDSLRATYAARHGSDAGFARVRQAMSRPRCAGCGRDEESVIACHNTARDALVRWDRPLDGDPSKIVRKMLAEDVDANA